MKEKNNERFAAMFQFAMLMWNIAAVVMISGFVYYTTQQIRYRYVARKFLDSVETIPHDPGGTFLRCILLMGLMVFSFILRRILEKKESPFVIATLFFDVIITVVLIFQLDFNYNGMILLVFANVIYYVKEQKMKLSLVALAILGYLVADYDFLALRLNLYNVRDYIQYYSATQQQYFLSIYNIMISMNIIMFIIYCIYVINTQRNTIEEVNMLYHELQTANDQLQEYANMSERMAQTRERNRLAREIHDTLGHTLTGIAAGLDACMTMIDISPDQTRKQLELLSKVSREGLKDVRRSVNELSPDSLERLRLDVAIRKMITDMSQVSGAQIYFDTDGTKLRFDEDEENAIYRVIQESVTNAVRHGNATEIWITLKKVDGEIRLVIKDNGIGCKEIKSGFGTKHIQERIEMLRGTVKFNGNNGFTVTAVIPIRWGEMYD